MTTVTERDVCLHLASLLNQPLDKLEPTTELTDLVTDSFALVEMAVTLQEDFDVFFRQRDLESVCTVGDVVALVLDRRRERV